MLRPGELLHLVEKYGEQRVFIGPPGAQATQEYFGWPELIAVTDLASACQAIETIIEEGEGARGDWRATHFGRFMQIMQEYRVLLQMLMRYFIHGKETEDELQMLASTAVRAMFMAIKPLGHLLSTLPIGADLPSKLAGPTFEIYRTGYVLPHHDAAWIVLHERLLELAAYCGKLGDQRAAPQADLQAIGANFRRLVAVLEPHVKTSRPGKT